MIRTAMRYSSRTPIKDATIYSTGRRALSCPMRGKMPLELPVLADCPFCRYLGGSREAVFVSRGRTVSVLVNARQYERGALLVVPNRHCGTLIDASDEEFIAVQLEARRMARLLVANMGATGVNVFQNAGARAGQTVGHYHVHVVPRYPDSDPSKIFREADYGLASREQLQAIATRLNRRASVEFTA